MNQLKKSIANVNDNYNCSSHYCECVTLCYAASCCVLFTSCSSIPYLALTLSSFSGTSRFRYVTLRLRYVACTVTFTVAFTVTPTLCLRLP